MSTYDNAPPPEGWTVTPKHCGLICFAAVCPVCSEWTGIPDNIELGDN